MSRLTIKDKEVQRWGNLLPKTNFAGDENIVGIQLADNLYTAHKYYVGKAVDKLFELEDVLEEFRIESAKELKARLQSESQLAKDGYELALENEELTKQLSKAIVPKFEIGQECWYVFNRYQREPIRCVIDRIYYDSDKNCKLRYDTSDSYYGGCKEEHLFATKAEAQAKLDEIRRNGNDS